MSRSRKEYIGETARARRFEDKVSEVRLRWFGSVCRSDDGFVWKRILKMGLPGYRKRGKAKEEFHDVVKENIFG